MKYSTTGNRNRWTVPAFPRLCFVSIRRILDKVFEQNYKTNEELPKDKNGNKVYNLAI